MGDFFNRHQRLLSLIGAFIVFMTFVVKEQLREKWKSTADALDLAQYVYFLSGIGEKGLEETLNVKAQLEAHATGEVMDQNIGDDYASAEHEEAYNSRLTRNLYVLSNRISTLNILSEHLGDEAVNQKVLSLQKSAGSSYDKAQNEDERNSMPLNRFHTKYENEPAFKHRPYSKEELEIFKNVIRVDEDVQDTRFETYLADWKASDALAKMVIQEAQRVRQQNERKSVWAGWVSTFLYIVGWGLGLLSKLEGSGSEAIEP